MKTMVRTGMVESKKTEWTQADHTVWVSGRVTQVDLRYTSKGAVAC